MNDPYIFLDDQISGTSRRYVRPLEIIRAQVASDVGPALEAVKAALAQGKYVAGYAAYELGYALDDKLLPLMPQNHGPLLEFGVFDAFDTQVPKANGPAAPPKLSPQWGEAAYMSRFSRLQDYIHAGDIYQANLTFPYHGITDTPLDMAALYAGLRARQPVRYGAIIALGETQILSLSPELFFSITGRTARARPMKGTAPRDPDPARDAANASEMQQDEKSKAENLMIVDLLRNDLSRIAKPGSVTVTDLFSIETFPTLHQMTSGIEATLSDNVGPAEVFAKLFPCGSVTGAPKIRAMEIIRELEDRPRGPYCGAIGYFDPGGDCSFNVAIRTLTSRPDAGKFLLEYNVGSGVVYDSTGKDEYAECRLKAQILTPPAPHLIETLRWSPHGGFDYLEGHMLRLMKAADDKGYALDPVAVMTALDDSVAGQSGPQRVRLALAKTGEHIVARSDLGKMPAVMRLKISDEAIDAENPVFAFKTSPMPLYDAARAQVKASADFDEIIFLNKRGELTEGSFTNIFIEIDGALYTPPLSCGLLPGVLRAHMLETGKAHERVLRARDITDTNKVYIGNSVRGLMPAALIF